MNGDSLVQTARALVGTGKGLLAADESNATCDRRLAAAGLEQTVQMRRAYREVLLTTPGLGECISGVILYEETLRQSTARGTPFVRVLSDAAMLVGIKVDAGTQALAAHPGELVTAGLDGLRERLHDYAELGARFAKWRAVFTLGGPGAGLPSAGAIQANANALARYAALCQEVGLVPIVEPEVLMDGDHTLARCQDVTTTVLRRVFEQLAIQRVLLEGLILKPNMVLSGTGGVSQATVPEVARATLECLLQVVPAAVAGVAFLSGGQGAPLATARLNAMHGPAPWRDDRPLPWPVTFSFARALQHPALEIWAGVESQRDAAQRALLHRARCNQAAVRGTYVDAMEAA